MGSGGNGSTAIVHCLTHPPSPSSYSFHILHQLPFPFIAGLVFPALPISSCLPQPPSLRSPCSFTQQSYINPSPPWDLGPCSSVRVLHSCHLLYLRGIQHWPRCWENYSLCSVRLPLLASPSPRLSCSHVVRFLSPSVVFLFSACVCTECHGFDIVIA